MAGLALTLREGESVFIGEDIQVRLERTKGRQAKLSFVAPKDTRILRESLLRATKSKDGKEGVTRNVGTRRT